MGLWRTGRPGPEAGPDVALVAPDPHLGSMGAEFEVHRFFHLPERSLFGLAGVIRQGMVEVGMEAELGGEDGPFTARVHGVEFVDPEAPGGEGSEPALLFSYSRPEKLEGWQAIEWPGKIVRLRWRAR